MDAKGGSSAHTHSSLLDVCAERKEVKDDLQYINDQAVQIINKNGCDRKGQNDFLFSEKHVMQIKNTNQNFMKIPEKGSVIENNSIKPVISFNESKKSDGRMDKSAEQRNRASTSKASIPVNTIEAEKSENSKMQDCSLSNKKESLTQQFGKSFSLDVLNNTLGGTHPSYQNIESSEMSPLDKTIQYSDALKEKRNSEVPLLANMTMAISKGPNIQRDMNSIARTSHLSNVQSFDSRPIYPNIPYSPYGSPFGSPRSNRRRPPLRESRRVSIEKSGSFLQLNQYKLLDQIGQGSYGLVKLAYSEEDSTHYAMKILSKKRLLKQAGLMKRGPKKATSPLDRVYREIAVLKKLDHPNVVKLIEVLDDPLEDALYMVFELVKHGEVLSVPTDNPLSEERALSVFRDTVLGLEYLHYQKIIHADIKPGNLLLTECGHVKIADLGVCNEFMGEDAKISNGSTAGTPAFRAPETLLVGQHMYCGKAADIWSLGATLYSLVFGNVPFIANTIPALYEKIKNSPLSFPTNVNVSDPLKDCIERMLTKDPNERITLPGLKNHCWVNADGTNCLPSEEENCCLVQISDDDINSVVRSIPKLDTLILIKTMLKKHSFGNPFFRNMSEHRSAHGGLRMERFVRAGRSNSAPGSYHLTVDRQLSSDKILPALSEISSYSTSEDN